MRRLRRQTLHVFGFIARDRAGVGSAEQLVHDLAADRAVLDPPRKIAAEVLRGALEAFVGEIAQHEFGILRADRLTTFDDVAAAMM